MNTHLAFLLPSARCLFFPKYSCSCLEHKPKEEDHSLSENICWTADTHQRIRNNRSTNGVAGCGVGQWEMGFGRTEMATRRLSGVMASMSGPNRFRSWALTRCKAKWWPKIALKLSPLFLRIHSGLSVYVCVRVWVSVLAGVSVLLYGGVCVCVVTVFDALGECVCVEYATSSFLGMACAHECHCLNYLDGVRFRWICVPSTAVPTTMEPTSHPALRRESSDAFWWATRRPKNNTSICSYARGPGVCHRKWFLMIGLIVSRVRDTHTHVLFQWKTDSISPFSFITWRTAYTFAQSVWVLGWTFKSHCCLDI